MQEAVAFVHEIEVPDERQVTLNSKIISAATSKTDALENTNVYR